MLVPMAPVVQPVQAENDIAQQADNLELEQMQTTTLVLRKLPRNLSSAQLRRMLDSADFEALYDFTYVPRDFKAARNLGYALVNFTEPAHALAAQKHFHGARLGSGVLVAELSHKHRGLRSLIEKYQISHVMTDPTLPDEHKPQLLRDGKVIPFPIVVTRTENEITDGC